MFKTLVHCDSIKGLQIGSKFDYLNCEISLNRTFRNVQKIKLLSLELPCVFYNIRDSFNTLTFKINGVNTSIKIPPGNYNEMSNLIMQINASINNNNILSGLFEFVDVGDFLQINSTISNINWSILNTTFSNHILGIQESDIPILIVSGSTTSRINTKWFNNLSIDTYLNLYISNILFKVCMPVQVGVGNILFLNQNLFFENSSSCDFSNLSSLTFTFRDRFNGEIESLGMAFSCSLEITHD